MLASSSYAYDQDLGDGSLQQQRSSQQFQFSDRFADRKYGWLAQPCNSPNPYICQIDPSR